MIHLPFKIIPLNSWYVYKIDKFPIGSDKPHFTVIIYNDGYNLKLFYITSKIEKAKILKRNDPASVVLLNVSDIEILTVDSCIKCGAKDIKSISLSDFKTLYEEEKIKFCCKLNDNIIHKIINGILNSKTYSKKEKDFYKSLLTE